jgi:hypothetical protein
MNKSVSTGTRPIGSQAGTGRWWVWVRSQWRAWWSGWT